MSAAVLAFVALFLVVGSAALWFRRAQAVRIPRNRSAFVASWLSGALLGVAARVQGSGFLGGIPAGIAVFVGCFLLFTVSISRQKLGSDPIRVGATLPDVGAPDENGESFALSSVRGKPVLLKFFRGHW